mmetsp:Transcript_22555/g.56668  ORF Transcript_22555/g.56668 Transcript_22555/m.56668 type:complete len:274 (-) Transcript_22555:42-863(-)
MIAAAVSSSVISAGRGHATPAAADAVRATSSYSLPASEGSAGARQAVAIRCAVSPVHSVPPNDTVQCRHRPWVSGTAGRAALLGKEARIGAPMQRMQLPFAPVACSVSDRVGDSSSQHVNDMVLSTSRRCSSGGAGLLGLQRSPGSIKLPRTATARTAPGAPRSTGSQRSVAITSTAVPAMKHAMSSTSGSPPSVSSARPTRTSSCGETAPRRQWGKRPAPDSATPRSGEAASHGDDGGGGGFPLEATFASRSARPIVYCRTGLVVSGISPPR